MKLSLEVKEDQELKKYIKSAIDGQIRGIARSEIQSEINGEIKRKFSQLLDGRNLDYMIRNYVESYIRKVVNNNYIEDVEFRQYVFKEVEKNLERVNWQQAVDEAAKTKIKMMIDK